VKSTLAKLCGGRDCILNCSVDRNEVSNNIMHSVGNDRSPKASGNLGWQVRSTLYSPVWRVTVVRRVGTWKYLPRYINFDFYLSFRLRKLFFYNSHLPKPLQLHDIISSGLWSEVKKLTLYRCYTYTNLDRRDKEISKFADNIVFFNLWTIHYPRNLILHLRYKLT
jgi:hypothetical protein